MSRYAEFDPRPSGHRKLGAEHVRSARPSDAPALHAIRAAREGRDAPAPPDDERARRRIRAELEGPGDNPWHVVVAEVDGEVVAYGRTRRLDHATSGLPAACPEGWYLTGVVVKPAWRRRGLGSRLTQARLDWLRGRAHAVHYVSNKQNHASTALHRRFGFEPQVAEFAYPRADLALGEGRLHTLALA